MDTKTRKQEALELLALDTLTGKQMMQLDILTLQQVGWSIKKARSGYYEARNPSGEIDMGMDIFMAENEGWVWVRKEYPFCTSVDACLTLPTPGRYWMLLTEPNNASLHNHDTHFNVARFENQRSLPVAMLKAWWNIQPD